MAVGMSNVNASAFSPDLKFFSNINSEGKLKIWDTENSVLKQEFTPNFHLNVPCTCLHWMKHTVGSPGKKKRKSGNRSFIAEDSSVSYSVLLGTSQGGILLYSLGEGCITGSIGQENSGHNASVSCLAWEKGNTLYSCADDCTIIEWNIKNQAKASMWSTGKDIPAALHIISKDILLSASRTIKMWCLKTKTLLRTFTGHSSLVSVLKSVNVTKENGKIDTYVISGARNDRFLNAWNISEKSRDDGAAANFLMEDIAYNLCIDYNPHDNGVCITAVTRSGVLHYYRHIMNGKCDKPLKPKLTMQVVFDNLGKQNTTNNKIQSVPILTGQIVTEDSILIGHGSQTNITFEKVKPQPIGKIQVLVRQNPNLITRPANEVSQKTKIPDAENVEYLGPVSSHTSNLKRLSGRKEELPMESRLENLSLVVDSKSKSSIPQFDSMSHLLLQGLHSKDKHILQSVLMKKDEKVIQNTISKLPVQYLVPLMKHLTSFMLGKSISAQIGTTWLRILLQSHAAHLMSLGSESLVDILSPCLGLIETRLSLLQPLSRLQGRLDLLINQISTSQNQDTEDFSEKNLLVYQDPDSSESDDEEMAGGQSTSDENWDEFSDEEEMAVDENNENDEGISESD